MHESEMRAHRQFSGVVDSRTYYALPAQKKPRPSKSGSRSLILGHDWRVERPDNRARYNGTKQRRRYLNSRPAQSGQEQGRSFVDKTRLRTQPVCPSDRDRSLLSTEFPALYGPVYLLA